LERRNAPFHPARKRLFISKRIEQLKSLCIERITRLTSLNIQKTRPLDPLYG